LAKTRYTEYYAIPVFYPVSPIVATTGDLRSTKHKQWGASQCSRAIENAGRARYFIVSARPGSPRPDGLKLVILAEMSTSTAEAPDTGEKRDARGGG
jgi:hypothetical protein